VGSGTARTVSPSIVSGLSYEAFCGFLWSRQACKASDSVQTARGIAAVLGKPDDLFLAAACGDDALVPALRKLADAAEREREIDRD
jgi:hypothetical protein